MTLQLALNVLMPTGLLGALALLYRARSDKRNVDAGTAKTGVDAAAVISETALEMLAPLRAELRAAHDEVDELRTAFRAVRTELDEYHRRYGPLSA